MFQFLMLARLNEGPVHDYGVNQVNKGTGQGW
jgi:hypothetical protein